MVTEQSDRRKKCHVLASEIGLTREERIELARVVFGDEDIASWSQLTEEQIVQMLDSLNGYEKISWLLGNR